MSAVVALMTASTRRTARAIFHFVSSMDLTTPSINKVALGVSAPAASTFPAAIKAAVLTVDSINAAAGALPCARDAASAATVLLYEAARQRPRQGSRETDPQGVTG